jgi:hypothetical protein
MMKKGIDVVFILTLFLLYPFIAEAVITTSPASLIVPRGLQTTKAITYNLASPEGCINATSNSGQFVSGANIILGVVNTSLSGNLAGVGTTSGKIVETLVIPLSVTKRAEQLGINRFEYRRQFSYSNCVGGLPPPETGSVQITLTSEATAEFRITRLQLYFENQRAEITVKRNQPGLKAYAEVRYVGSGLLQGYWEMDGRILSHVNRHLVYGRSVTLETPEIPSLPTFVTGTHIVRFVITSPSGDLPTPEAIYFVTAEEFERTFSIRLISPEDRSEIEYTSPTFRWEGRDQTVTYLVEFLEESGEKPIFSAYTRKPDYALPLPVFKSLFSQGKSYLWRVKGFDVDNNIIGESPVFKFTFKEISSYLPGQILVVTETSLKGLELIGKIGGKYDLGLIETFDIRSLNLKVAIFKTGRDILDLIDAILREEGVVLAQPHYIFRTLSEPMCDQQNIYRILNLKRLHEYARGQGVIVAVIDTGVDAQHKDLKERVMLSENLLKEHPFRPEIHGTAMAGVIGASINGFGIAGVAPESQILALRACRQIFEAYPEGECYTASVAKAIDIAIEKKARIVNMSLGSISPDRLISRLIEEGSRKGLLFVAPVGNSPRQKALTFPASHPDVVSVGGLDDRGQPYPKQEVATQAMVCAPSTNVLTTVPGDKLNFLSGTSMASASVSGILAVAAERDGALRKKNIPPFEGDICKWQEELLRLPICRE